MEGVQALPGRLEAFLQSRRAPTAGIKASSQPLLASKLRADAGEAIRVRPCCCCHATLQRSQCCKPLQLHSASVDQASDVCWSRGQNTPG